MAFVKREHYRFYLQSFGKTRDNENFTNFATIDLQDLSHFLLLLPFSRSFFLTFFLFQFNTDFSTATQSALEVEIPGPPLIKYDQISVPLDYRSRAEGIQSVTVFITILRCTF